MLPNLVFYTALVAFSIQDILERRLTLFFVALFLGLGFVTSFHGIGLIPALAGASAAFLHVTIYAVLLNMIFGEDRLIGGGDVWLLIGIGLWKGWFWVIVVMAGATTIAMLFYLISKKKSIPFVPFLTVACGIMEVLT